MILYLFQLVLGVIIHFLKTPSFMGGRRPPQNYFHAILGLVTIALAFYQVHYGIKTEWYEATLGDGTVVPESALHAWIALIVVSCPRTLRFQCKWMLTFDVDFLGSVRGWAYASSATVRAGSSRPERHGGKALISFDS